MKKIALITVIILLMTSCSSQKTIDLAEIEIPYPSNKLLNETVTYKRSPAGLFIHLESYRTYDSNLLNFNDTDLSGRLTTSKNKFLNDNFLVFHVDPIKKTIPFFEIEILTTKQSQNLFKALLKKLGEPVYYRKDDEIFYGVWEKDTITYLFAHNYQSSINGIDTELSDLRIIDNTDKQLIDRFYSAGFQYFGDYVYERAKRNDPNYTYLQFAKYQAKERWDENYLKEIKSNKPLED